MNAYTAKQGQYLAFIYYYEKLNEKPPSEADLSEVFQGRCTICPSNDHYLGTETTYWQNTGSGTIYPFTPDQRSTA